MARIGARNRGIKILNEFLIENPRAYPILTKNSSNNNRRPMTVNYQAPIENDLFRPFSSHLKKKPEALRILPPPPSIREVAEVQATRLKEIPKNTGTSLLNELNLKQPKKGTSKCSLKIRRSRLAFKKFGKEKEIVTNQAGKGEVSKKGPTSTMEKPTPGRGVDQMKIPQKPNKKDGKPCKFCVPDSNSSESPVKFQNTNKKVEDMIKNRLSKPKIEPKKNFDLIQNVKMDGSSFLIEQLKNIKDDLLKVDRKISMKDASIIINDIKGKINSAVKIPSMPFKVNLQNLHSEPPPARQAASTPKMKTTDQAAYKTLKFERKRAVNLNQLKYEKKVPDAKPKVIREKQEKNPLQQYPPSPLRDIAKVPSKRVKIL